MSLHPSVDEIVFNDVYVNTNLVPGDCDGAITARKGTNGELIIDYQIVPAGDPLTPDCEVFGELELITPGSVDFVADNH